MYGKHYNSMWHFMDLLWRPNRKELMEKKGVGGVPAAKKVQSTSTSKPLRGAGGHKRRTKTPELLTVKVSAMEALR